MQNYQLGTVTHGLFDQPGIIRPDLRSASYPCLCRFLDLPGGGRGWIGNMATSRATTIWVMLCPSVLYTINTTDRKITYTYMYILLFYLPALLDLQLHSNVCRGNSPGVSRIKAQIISNRDITKT